MEHLRRLLPKLKAKKILILGDLMLDEHIWSKVSRISPEAPVPVAEVSSITHVPGGAGNVAVNITELGGKPYIIGIIGTDSSGGKLLSALRRNKISTKYIIIDKHRPTILKSRIIAVSQHVVRVDREDKNPIGENLTKKVLPIIKSVIKKVDAVLISDYGKGIVTPKISRTLIAFSKKYKIPVAVDPKGSNYSKYKGATIITPNFAEAEAAAGSRISSEQNLIQAGRKLLKKIKTDYVLITRGRDGMSLFSKEENFHIRAIPREVFDITGAGDAVIATLTLAISAGASMKDAAILSNYSGAIVVGKIGTAPVKKGELEAALEEGSFQNKKVRTLEELQALIGKFKLEGRKIVFTNGCFDLLHAGHIRYLKEAKSLGDILIVGLNSDSSVRKIKGLGRPYIGEAERAEILAALEFVDYVTIFDEETPNNLISKLKPDIHVKGGDYKGKYLPEAKIVESYGGKVVVVSKVPHKSTTALIERIKGG